MQIVDVKKETAMPHLNLFRTRYQDKTGREKTWTFASRTRLDNPYEKTAGPPDAVVVVPFHTEAGKLVIIREFRVVLAGYQFGFPAGLLDPGEDIVQAARRELFEETGLRLHRVCCRGPAVYSSSGMTDETVSLVFAECGGHPSSAHTEDSEDIEVIMLSRTDAAALLADPSCCFDVKTWIVLQEFSGRGVMADWQAVR